MGQADVDRVQPRLREHPGEVGEGGDPGAVEPQQSLVQVANRGELGYVGVANRRQMVLADLSQAAEPDPHATPPGVSRAATWAAASLAAASGLPASARS